MGCLLIQPDATVIIIIINILFIYILFNQNQILCLKQSCFHKNLCKITSHSVPELAPQRALHRWHQQRSLQMLHILVQADPFFNPNQECNFHRALFKHGENKHFYGDGNDSCIVSSLDFRRLPERKHKPCHQGRLFGDCLPLCTNLYPFCKSTMNSTDDNTRRQIPR